MNDKETWLAERRKFITASAVAAMLGESPHKTREQLMMEKRGDAKEFQGDENTDLGLWFEGRILEWAAMKYGWDVQPNGLKLHVDSVCPRLAATPDATVMSPWGLAVLQVKWTTCTAQEDCKATTKSGAPTTAAYAHGAPIEHQIQVQSEIACVNAACGVLLVLHTSGRHKKIRPYFVARHDGVIARIRREVVAFWEEIEGVVT